MKVSNEIADKIPISKEEVDWLESRESVFGITESDFYKVTNSFNPESPEQTRLYWAYQAYLNAKPKSE